MRKNHLSSQSVWNIPQLYLQLGVQLREARFYCCTTSSLEMQIIPVGTVLIANNDLNTVYVIGGRTNVTLVEYGSDFGSCGGPA